MLQRTLEPGTGGRGGSSMPGPWSLPGNPKLKQGPSGSVLPSPGAAFGWVCRGHCWCHWYLGGVSGQWSVHLVGSQCQPYQGTDLGVGVGGSQYELRSTRKRYQAGRACGWDGEDSWKQGGTGRGEKGVGGKGRGPAGQRKFPDCTVHFLLCSAQKPHV